MSIHWGDYMKPLRYVAAGLLIVGALACSKSPAPAPSDEPTSPTVTASPDTSPSPEPLFLGPFGYGALTLGMTKSAANATGLTTGIDTGTPAGCGAAGDGQLAGAPPLDFSELQGWLVFQSGSGGLVSIYAFAGVETPQGIKIGSTKAEVVAAYPTFETFSGVDGEEDGRGGAPVPGNPDAHYRIVILDGKVFQLSLDANNQACYE
jgi:hypothetical protein